MLEVLVTAVLRLSHAALGAMAERGHGGIINVSSVAAFLPRGTYSAAKAWVNSFSEWAHLEYKSRGVQVMALCPGFTKTEFHERMQVKRGDGFMWLDVDFLVRKSLAGLREGPRLLDPRRAVQDDRSAHQGDPQPGAAADAVDGASLSHSFFAADASAQTIPLLPSWSAITVSPGALLSSTTVPPAATAAAIRCSRTSAAT